ncbi:zinc finger transcription factor [Scheffersomyces xylosifermentans]|uniref:zinc finger transcription factor n=1 Tax=Scheffersomyces xylosifermentans TaxID=1304137 RepID=UPI00315D833B
MNSQSPASPGEDYQHSSVNPSGTGSTTSNSLSNSLSSSLPSGSHIKKKRVGKACDSCRIKKTKCDGKKPCNRCIIDNKICVFTEKKKPKEKNHPQGYVELLETRLDILTKSLEKLIQLSRPHLPFLEEIIQDQQRKSKKRVKTEYNSEESDNEVSSDYDSDDQNVRTKDNELDETNAASEEENAIPINKVVAYLINKQGLLNNLPVEWEHGAMIAANYNAKKNLEKSSKLFAEHKSTMSSESRDSVSEHHIHHSPLEHVNEQETSHTQQQDRHPHHSIDQRPGGNLKKRSSSISVKKEEDTEVLYEDEEDLTLASPPGSTLSQISLTEQFNLNDFSLGGYSSGGLALAATAPAAAVASTNNNNLSSYTSSNNEFIMSDFESDSNSMYSQHFQQPQFPMNQQQAHQLAQFKLHQQQQQLQHQGVKLAKTESISPPDIENFPKRANSLFLSNSGTTVEAPPMANSSVTSLTSKYESHSLTSPTDTASPLNTTLRRSSSSLTQRPFSPSYSKMKNSGHVHKPSTHPHPHRTNSSSSAIISNNGNEFHITGKRNSLSSNSSTTSTHTTPNGIHAHATPTLFANTQTATTSLSPQSVNQQQQSHIPQSQPQPFYEGGEATGKAFVDFPVTFDELPSDAFKIGGNGAGNVVHGFNQYQNMDIVENENYDNIIIANNNNPFAK